MTSDTTSIAVRFPTTISMFEDLTQEVHPVEGRYLTGEYPADLTLYTWEPEESPLQRYFRPFTEVGKAKRQIEVTYQHLREARNELKGSEEDVFK